MAEKFDFQKRLGAGHFGEVWLANDTGLNAVRAIKLIPPSKVLNPTNFFHEAQILKAAEHPNVIKVEETGTLSDGRIYVGMEYLPKGSLEDEVKGAYIDVTRAKRIMIDVLRGLEHAHSKNILHRDIKPANILIGHNSEGKLSDFGLAIPANLNLAALGAKDYAYILHQAPEVFQGQTHHFSGDIYACGVTLYRLINGDSYLPALLPVEVRDACLQGKFPDRNHYREFICKSLKVVINKAINVDPSKRYSSAKAMRHALEQVVVVMNWNEKKLPNGYRWSCGCNNKCYEVVRIEESKGRYSVTVKTGKSKSALRKITSLCQIDLTLQKAQQLTRKILQDYAAGKVK